MEFDQSDWIVTILLVILGLSVLIATVVIAKTFIHEAKEKKARAARLAEEEKKMASELQTPAKAPSPAPAPAAKASEEIKSPSTPAHKDDVNDSDDLIAAAEVYLTYELKEQAITSLEKHLLTNPTDEKALALLKKAEASN